MARESFVPRDFKPETLAVIERANTILESYAADNMIVTLRQLYYQFVSKGWITNETKSYKRLGSIINDARLAGLIDWSTMEDRVRSLETISTWENPSEIVDAVAAQYREDLWRPQRNRVEVWIEKDALVGVIERVCRELRVEYFACRGNVSQSAMYEAGKRLQGYINADVPQKVTILHLGDHDPNGIDMSRDNADRLRMFTGRGVTLKRIALTLEQVEQYNPPPNPAKESDSRYESYVREFGITDCWELDALEPRVLQRLIRNEVTTLRDNQLWKEFAEQEAYNKSCLQRVSRRWDEVEELVKEEPAESGDDE